MKKNNIIKFAITFLFVLSIIYKPLHCENLNSVHDTLDIMLYKKLEIIDSAICKTLDSVISYEEYCHKRKKNYPYFYKVIVNYDSLNNDKEIFIFSKIGNINTDSSIAVLYYKKRYFMFENYENWKIKEIYNYLKLSTETILIKNLKKPFINYGKTYSMITITMEKDTLYISNKNCFCNYGKLSRMSKFLSFRMFFYKIFCPCRASRRL